MTFLRSLTAKLVADGGSYKGRELEPEGGCDQRQREISRQMTRLVDVLYALVLVQGAINYSFIFTAGGELLTPERSVPVVLALLLIYFIAIQSFIDYHLASEVQPYRLLDGQRRRNDLTRFYLDVVIVGLYSFFLLRCHVLIADPAANLAAVFIGLAAMFLLYLLWGELRWWTKPDKPEEESGKGDEHLPYRRGLLVVGGVLYAILAVAYILLAEGWEGNVIFLLIALALMVVYRAMNWSQNRTCQEAATRTNKEPPPPPACAEGGGPEKPRS